MKRGPKIEQLQEALGVDADALDTFWFEVEATGAPLVEEVQGQDDLRWLTFLWRDRDGDTRNVVVEGGLATLDPTTETMTHLEDTDLWFKTYLVPSGLRTHYLLSPNDSLEIEDWQGRQTTFQTDPLNPRSFLWPANASNPEAPAMRYSIVELPEAPKQPWVMPRHGVPAGTVSEHPFRSEILGNERRIWVHVPAGVQQGATEFPSLVLLDGWEWACAEPLAPTLDNLIAAGAIPPMVTVMVESLDYLTRGMEYPCYEPFVRSLADELLPWMRDRWRATADPARTIVAGQSYGGLAATFAGFTRPDIFGSVLSQSGSFWWIPGWEELPVADLADRGWLIDRFEEAPRLPLRVYLDIGTPEYAIDVESNRIFRDVLTSKGYDLTYREFDAGHHWLCWRGTIADALIALTDTWT